MSDHEKDSFRTVVAFAPFVFAAHFAEEVSGFVKWLNVTVVGGMTDRREQNRLLVAAGVGAADVHSGLSRPVSRHSAL